MTAVLERDGISTATYTTEPYEVAWAGEARWFVRVLDLPDTVDRVDFVVQISPDGLYWCDLDGEAHTVSRSGVHSWVSREFGGWLRLRASVHGAGAADASVVALIYLALKA